jgi:hypothetical protein
MSSSTIIPNDGVEVGNYIYVGLTGPFANALGKWVYVAAIERSGRGKLYFRVVLADGTLTGVWAESHNQLVHSDVPDEFTTEEVARTTKRLDGVRSGLQAGIDRLTAVHNSTPANPYREP